MKTLTLKGSQREKTGSKTSADLRRQEMVPCVLYGGKETIHFAANEKEFKDLVYTPDAHMVKIDVGGRTFDAIMREIQFHKITDKVIHIDFQEVAAGKPVTIEIPVKTHGSAVGVRAGGKLQIKFRTLTAKGMIDKLPESVVVEVEKMEIGDSVRVSDLKYPGVEFLNRQNATVVGVRVTRIVEEEVPVAAAATAEGAAGATPAAGAAGAAPAAPGKEGAPAAGKDAAKPAGKDAAKK